MIHHDFIDTRRTRTRPKKLEVIEYVTKAKKVSGKGNSYQYTKTGARPDLGATVYRSGWEADIARVLTVYGINFEFEPKVYSFPLKRGIKAYVPDFYLPKTNEFIEIKGWFDDASRIKLKRWKKYYPEDFAQLHVIISKYAKKARITCEQLGVPNVMHFEDFKTSYNWIPNWESK